MLDVRSHVPRDVLGSPTMLTRWKGASMGLLEKIQGKVLGYLGFNSNQDLPGLYNFKVCNGLHFQMMAHEELNEQEWGWIAEEKQYLVAKTWISGVKVAYILAYPGAFHRIFKEIADLCKDCAIMGVFKEDLSKPTWDGLLKRKGWRKAELANATSEDIKMANDNKKIGYLQKTEKIKKPSRCPNKRRTALKWSSWWENIIKKEELLMMKRALDPPPKNQEYTQRRP